MGRIAGPAKGLPRIGGTPMGEVLQVLVGLASVGATVLLAGLLMRVERAGTKRETGE